MRSGPVAGEASSRSVGEEDFVGSGGGLAGLQERVEEAQNSNSELVQVLGEWGGGKNNTAPKLR